MQDFERYQEDTVEINLIDLFWAVLRHWRSILLAMLILGVVLAGYGAIKEYRHLTDEDFVKEQEEAYRSNLETYELKKKQLEKKLQNLEEDMVRQEFYEKNAIMLFFDEYNVYIQTASYFVNTGYEIAPELYFQNPNYTGVITNSYKAAIDRIDLDAVISTIDNPDLTTRNPISGSKKMLYTTVDAGNGVLNISIYGDTEERVQQIYAAVKKVIAEQETLLGQVIGEHTIELLSEKNYTDIDTEWGSLQDSFDNKSESITKGIEDTKKDLESLKEPINETPTKVSVLKGGIKYGIIGLAIGLVFLSVIYLVQLIIQDKLNNVEDIHRRYSAPLIGAYTEKPAGWTKIDSFFAMKLGMPITQSNEEQLRYIASKMVFYLKDRKKVLLIGNCEIDKLNSLKKLLGDLLLNIEIKVGGNVNESAFAIETLADKAAIVCVEKWSKTFHRDIRHEIKTISASDNINIGYIVIT